MIINHNMNAMNAHRMMSGNTATAGKSMEKLSSGLRINRAGDDAAGLAISEKMRAQIRGLDQASRNSQDGISMVQTAEGALNETHSILQRMRELAVQAGNDTNAESDRTEIQNEINQLTSEINRIGNTTEFNTKKLLNGGNQIDVKAVVSGESLTGGLDAGNIDGTATETSLGVNQEAAVWDSGAWTALTNGQSGTITFNGAVVTINGADNAGVGDDTTIGVATGTAVTITLDTAGAATAAQQITHIVTALNNMKTAGGVGGALEGFTITADTAGSGVKIADTLANGDTNNAFAIVAGGANGVIANVGAAAQFAAGDGNAGVDGVAASGNVRFNGGDGVPAEGTSITLANKTIAFYDSTSGNFDSATHAKTALSADYVVDINGITTGAGIAQAVVNAVNTAPISGYAIAVDGTNADQVNVTATSTGVSGLIANELAAATNATLTAATGSVTLTGVPTENSKITIGNSEIGFYDSTSGNYADAAEALAELGTDYVIDINGKTTVNAIKDAVLALDPQIAEVTLADGGVGKINITAATAGAAGNQIGLIAPEAAGEGFTANLQIGANASQSFTVSINDMRSVALNVSSATGAATITASDGKIATMTLGTANVTDGTSSTGTEFALDISAHDKASAAISVIDDAIKNVSAQRSQLGAYQNRLEHTIANLGTASENLTSAESRIRDVDLAKEMMQFSKNNILSQAAQAMLAQANSAPNGVLQLLR